MICINFGYFVRVPIKSNRAHFRIFNSQHQWYGQKNPPLDGNGPWAKWTTGEAKQSIFLAKCKFGIAVEMGGEGNGQRFFGQWNAKRSTIHPFGGFLDGQKLVKGDWNVAVFGLYFGHFSTLELLLEAMRALDICGEWMANWMCIGPIGSGLAHTRGGGIPCVCQTNGLRENGLFRWTLEVLSIVHSVQLESVKPKKEKHWLNIWAAQSVLGWHVSFYFLKWRVRQKIRLSWKGWTLADKTKPPLARRRPSPPLVGCQLIPTGPANVWPILLAKGNWQIPAGQAKWEFPYRRCFHVPVATQQIGKCFCGFAKPSPKESPSAVSNWFLPLWRAKGHLLLVETTKVRRLAQIWAKKKPFWIMEKWTKLSKLLTVKKCFHMPSIENVFMVNKWMINVFVK